MVCISENEYEKSVNPVFNSYEPIGLADLSWVQLIKKYLNICPILL